MQKTGLCGERLESELARDIWTQVREEAVAAVEHDRAMSEIIRDTVLTHDNFGDALAHRLARKLGDYALSIESLEVIFCEAFGADPGIEISALADLTAVRDRDPACPDLLTPFLFFKGYQAIQAYRFSHLLWKRGRLHLAKHLQSRAAEVFGVALEDVTRDQRGQAKTINFGIIYGVSAFGLSSRIEGLSRHGAQDLIDAYNKRFPGIEKFGRDAVRQAQEHGYVETILGRRRPITEINSSIIAQRRGAERAAGNTVIQGSAADLIKMAMVKLHRRMKRENLRSRLLLQVHDELVFETPIESVESEAAIIREEMVNAMKLSVPLKVEVGWGKNWADAKCATRAGSCQLGTTRKNEKSPYYTPEEVTQRLVAGPTRTKKTKRIVK